jgi:hypothetical protein
MSLGKPKRISSILVLSLVALAVFWAVFSWWFVPGLIERAYYGQSLPFINQMILGQSLHPVGEYLAAWNRFAWIAALTLVFAGLLLILVVCPEFQDFFWGPILLRTNTSLRGCKPHRAVLSRGPSSGNPPPIHLRSSACSFSSEYFCAEVFSGSYSSDARAFSRTNCLALSWRDSICRVSSGRF